MKLYLKTRTGADAQASFNPETNEFVVLKGSKVAPKICRSAKFNGYKSIEAKRDGIIDENYVLKKNVTFSSSSTAANFVTGSSTNGLKSWKDKDGTPLGGLDITSKRKKG